MGGSGARMRDRKKAEKRYETASTRTASGALKTWISTPPMSGPATWASERLPLNIELAVRYSSRSTTVTNCVLHEMSKATPSVPAMNVVTNSWGNDRAPITNDTAMLPTTSARPRSATIISRRRWWTRSSHTPAGSEKSRLGNSPAAVSRPICSGEAPRFRTAMIGIASSVTWSPKTEIVWPSHRSRKAGRLTIGGQERTRSGQADLGTPFAKLRRLAGEWPNGKAPDSGSGDSRFESLLASQLLPLSD